MKKFYTMKFKESTSFFEIKSKKQRKLVALEYISEFIETQLADKLLELKSRVSKQVLTFYFGKIIVPEYVSKKNITVGENKEISHFYDCIYNYTNGNLKKLAKSFVFCSLFKNFVEEDHFLEMTRVDETLIRNPEIYLARAHGLLEMFGKAGQETN